MNKLKNMSSCFFGYSLGFYLRVAILVFISFVLSLLGYFLLSFFWNVNSPLYIVLSLLFFGFILSEKTSILLSSEKHNGSCSDYIYPEATQHTPQPVNIPISKKSFLIKSLYQETLNERID